MRISLKWLQELVDINMTPEALGDALTMAGFEVEDLEDRQSWAEGVVIGHVLQCDPHPNADKLSVCQVDIGESEPSTIVCGAANIRAGVYVPVATVNSYLPKVDLKIRPRKLRGVASAGMICSLTELGLTKDSDGIHIFGEDAEDSTFQPGQDARAILGLDDVVLDLSSTANRADALSMVGIAREVAAITGAELKLPTAPEPTVQKSTISLAIETSEPQACPLYVGTVVENIKIGPSPDWLQQRLQAAGTRPINNVVDITNYVLLEWGQPLHGFDLDCLQSVAGSSDVTMGVRFAQNGESLTTLDGKARSLQEQTLLITANDRPVALGGVMGGEATEVHAETKTLMLEAAYFDSAVIRRSARSQGLRTEASARYERGINLTELDLASNRALHLITELAGGTVTVQQAAKADTAPSTRVIDLRLDRVNAVLGPVRTDTDEMGQLQAQDIERTLTVLGCTVTAKSGSESGTAWEVTIPPYRYRDLEREIDLIEEVARLYGYNNFCDTLPQKTEPGYLSPQVALTRKLREAMRAAGLTELLHYSLGKPTGERQIVLANPIFAEYSALRSVLLPSLIDAFQYNLEQGNGLIHGFELGRIFWVEEEGLKEADAVAGIFAGNNIQGSWQGGSSNQGLTWFEAKGVLESIFTRLSLSVEYQPDRANKQLHPGRTASLWLEGDRLGTFGQLHPELCQARDLPKAVYAFEMNLAVILANLDQPEQRVPLFAPYSTYPAAERDLAFFASTEVSVAEINRLITKLGKSLLESVELFDEYRGDNVPDGQRSLAFRLTYRAGDRTLKEKEIETVHQKVREGLEEKFGVSLRS